MFSGSSLSHLQNTTSGCNPYFLNSRIEFCNGLVYRYQRGIVSTSANISGAPSPTDFASISETIKSQVDCILKPENSDKKGGLKSSKIIKLGLGGEYTMIRS